ncbi:hypothetical protein PVAND_008709 [Polypedilum vanderplanki]|uniref:Uncharacterized protein n=1 Tax=Polypedilum vanderplanki TaxID=319348 RepID=A0A9J6CB32_POLVA|nr:hypothetical protein PVAND_008709 [Polypedilum vanderplanki]
MKLSFTFLLCCLTILKFSSADSMTIQCNYLERAYKYSCDVVNRKNFTSDRVSIEKAEGQHLRGKNDNSVEAFGIIGAPTLKLFPSDINNVFKNLTQIAITHSSLTEITSNDLKVFPKLRVLYLAWNKIESIKGDTFQYNPELEIISLTYNKIKKIDPKAFSGLTRLTFLNLENNVCELERKSGGNREKVLSIVKEIENNACNKS